MIPSSAAAPLAWTLVVEPAGRAGWDNMARDLALLDLAARDGAGYLRLYRWSPPCLSFGCHEPAARRYDRARIAELGLDTVRRPTGGRAVWHDEELTYALAAPAAAFGSLPAAYHAIHGMLADALVCLGVPATLAPPPARAARLDAGACFARPAGGEVLAGGLKVIGSAQLRRGGALLQHGSVLLDGNQATVAAVALDGSLGAEPAVGTLARALGRPVGFEETARAIADATRAACPGRWTEAPPAALDTAAAPHASSFRAEDWTWRR